MILEAKNKENPEREEIGENVSNLKNYGNPAGLVREVTQISILVAGVTN